MNALKNFQVEQQIFERIQVTAGNKPFEEIIGAGQIKNPPDLSE